MSLVMRCDRLDVGFPAALQPLAAWHEANCDLCCAKMSVRGNEIFRSGPPFLSDTLALMKHVGWAFVSRPGPFRFVPDAPLLDCLCPRCRRVVDDAAAEHPPTYHLLSPELTIALHPHAPIAALVVRRAEALLRGDDTNPDLTRGHR